MTGSEQVESKRVGTLEVRSPRGLKVESFEGVGGTRSGAAASRLDDAIARVNRQADGADHDVTTLAAVTLTATAPARGARGGYDVDLPDEPFVDVVAPPAAGDARSIAVVDEDGFITFLRPIEEDGRQVFRVPLTPQAPGGDRGFGAVLGRVAVRVLGVVAKPGVAAVTRRLLSEVEERRRPYGMSALTEDGSWRPIDRGARVIDAPNALLLLHGINSNAAQAFRFDGTLRAALWKQYGPRVFAFDHPSVTVSPMGNAAELAGWLSDSHVGALDVLAHSRGGIVARELLARRITDVSVRSVVFVATPNDGTPLADRANVEQLLSMATNALSLLPDNPVTDVLATALEIVREWMLEPLASLEGLEPLAPGSETLTRLAAQATDARLRAIAADYEPRAHGRIPARLRDGAMDRIFKGERNDLVVPTRSVYAERDRFRIAPEDRLVLDSSFGVAHSLFWREAAVVRQLSEWLHTDRALNAAEVPAPSLRDATMETEQAMATVAVAHAPASPVTPTAGGVDARVASTGTAADRRERGLVVLLPGIMGSKLSVDGGTRPVWLDAWNIVCGRFVRLKLGAADVSVAGLMPQYAKLHERIAERYDVLSFPYDWRRPLADQVGDLERALHDAGYSLDPDGGDRPLHFVAHSMGGLLARAFLGEHRDYWRAGTGRLVQLGTPNGGSYAMPLVMLGTEVVVKALCAVDTRHGSDEILDVVRSFPGVFDLFPSPHHGALAEDRPADPERGGDPLLADARAVFFDPAYWSARKAPLDALALEASKAFHARLQEQRDLERVVFVAGDGHRTPFRAQREADGAVSIGITTAGDGRVAHALGPDALRGADKVVHYCPSSHGDLVSDQTVLAEIHTLLAGGVPGGFAKVPGTFRAVPTAEDAIWVKPDDVETVVGLAPLPSRSGAADEDPGATVAQAATAYLGGVADRRAALPPLRVRLVHGSLEQAKHAVVAGRYRGIEMGGALAFIDDRLNGALRDLYRADLGPQDPGTGCYVPAPAGVYPRGAIVLGLGDFGTLTSQVLTRAVQHGVADYVVAEHRSSGAVPVLGVSSVLAGTPGRYGLSVTEALEATIRGVALAAEQLADLAVVDELEFVELYEGAADEAAQALAKLQIVQAFADLRMTIDIDPQVDPRAGGRPGSRRSDESGAAWPRVMLEVPDRSAVTDDTALDLLRYVSIGRGSTATHLEVAVDFDEILGYVRSAVAAPDDTQTSNTLYELLFPNEGKLDLETFDNLHLLVDEHTAWIPWEMLTGRSPAGDLLPGLALRSGMLRQLKPAEARAARRPLGGTTDDVLVIGDPPAGAAFPRLPGARLEAEEVAGKLGSRYTVRERIYREDDKPSEAVSAQIVNDLFARPYRIIHVAAHGWVPDVPGVGDGRSRRGQEPGIVIGEGRYLTARHFTQRPVPPELVFLNCCHVGATGTQDARGHYAELAGSLSLALLRSGVRAVVCAGWAVDDRAAREFAGTFYACLLEGESFGEATRRARRAAHHVGRSNTWGAYQCYGDPDFQLDNVAARVRPSQRLLSPSLTLGRLAGLARRAGDSADQKQAAEVRDQLIELERTEVMTRYPGSARVWQALAEAYAEAGAFVGAVVAYRRAVYGEGEAAVSVKSVQQLCNLEARLAAETMRSAAASGTVLDAARPDPWDDEMLRTTEVASLSPGALFASAELRLARLATLLPSAECSALRGSLYKKWASVTADSTLRRTLLEQSLVGYLAACDLAPLPRELPPYHGCMALLVQYALADERSDEHTALWTRLDTQWSSYRLDDGDYWKRAQWADIQAVNIVAIERKLADDTRRKALIEGFETAFGVRSSVLQRRSVIDNYLELADLLRDDLEKSAARAVAERLAQFGNAGA